MRELKIRAAAEATGASQLTARATLVLTGWNVRAAVRLLRVIR